MNSLLDTNQEDQIQIDENADFVEQLTGPGGKFDRTKYASDQEMISAIAKSKVFADATIEVQNRKMDEIREDARKLREERMTGSTLKEVLDQIAELKQSNPRDNTQHADLENKTVFDPTQLDSLVDNRALAMIERREAKILADGNFKKVQDKILETFGPNYQTSLKQHIAEQGLSVEDVDALARKSPSAAIKLLGLDEVKQDGFDAPMKNQQRSSFTPKGGEKRTWSWYQKMRATDRKRYDDPKTQAQMYADAATLGKDFRDGNFYNL